MKRRNLSVLFAMIFCALLVRAQDVPPPDMGDADPLDVLEPQHESSPEIPTVPEFTEIPEPGSEPEYQEPPPVELPAAPKKTTTPQVAESTSSIPEGSNEPDYDKEARFHRIYSEFNQQPTSEESWEKALAGREGQTYHVQKGDTLYDLSTTFFGDSNYWPKIWSQNNQSILNPHQIDPNMVISFYPGSTADAPTLGLADADSLPAEEDKVVVEKLANGTEVAVPPRTKKTVPVLKSLPTSLPNMTVNGLVQKTAPVVIDLPKTKFPQAVEYMSYFISDTPVAGIGKVIETELDVKSAMEFQYIFVEINDPSPIGKRFMIQRSRGEVKDPARKEAKGYVIEVQGTIEVVARVNDNKPVYRAIVTKTLEHVEVGSEVVVGNLPVMQIKPTPVVSSVGAKIIGGQFASDRKMFGTNTLVFLDAGSSQGVQEGQTLNVYADQRVRNDKTLSVVNDRVIGAVKVVRVASNFSTAYVLNTDMDILAGDYVGRPMSQARNFVPQAESASPAIDSDLDLELDSTPAPEAPEAAPSGGDEDLDLEL